MPNLVRVGRTTMEIGTLVYGWDEKLFSNFWKCHAVSQQKCQVAT